MSVVTSNDVALDSVAVVILNCKCCIENIAANAVDEGALVVYAESAYTTRICIADAASVVHENVALVADAVLHM